MAFDEAGIVELTAHYGWLTWVLLACGYAFAGFVKGAIGFALPMVALTIGALLLPSDAAVACLAIPTLLTNIFQSARDGVRAGVDAFRDFRLMIFVMLSVMIFSTQLLPVLSERGFAAIVGSFIFAAGLAQLLGWRLKATSRPGLDIGAGLVAGFFGGLSGTWGPPVMMTLVALGLEKRRMVRVAGVMFLTGSVPFLLGHLWSGVLNANTAIISALLFFPTMAGMIAGQMVQDKMDQDVFRRVILFVLIIAGLNFLRRAMFS